MGLRVNLDTNVFLAIKNKEPLYEYCERILNEIENKEIEGIISTIVLAEVLVGFFQKNEENEATRFSSSALLNLNIIPVDQEIATKAAYIRAHHGIKLPDALIIATTLLTEANFFITHDKIIHEKINMKIITPKEFVDEYLRDQGGA